MRILPANCKITLEKTAGTKLLGFQRKICIDKCTNHQSRYTNKIDGLEGRILELMMKEVVNWVYRNLYENMNRKLKVLSSVLVD